MCEDNLFLERIINDSPTVELINFLWKYDNCYGTFSYDNTSYEKAFKNYKNALKNIDTSSITEGNKYVYAIKHKKDILVGYLFVKDTKCFDDYELSIVIYDEFKGLGYATQVMGMYLHDFYQNDKKLSVIIKQQNPNKEIVISILNKFGFSRVEKNATLSDIEYCLKPQ